MTFYLGIPEPAWMRRTDVPVFISHHRLDRVRHLQPAAGPYAIDSGGFTELSLYGRWRTSARRYLAAVRRYIDQLGEPDFAAQDMMCEPDMLKRTGLTVETHQLSTVLNYIGLRNEAPEIPWLPVVQGWTVSSYLRCVELYDRVGVDLRTLPRVGVGSVCRRESTLSASLIFGELAHRAGLGNLHGFGLRSRGLSQFGETLASSDSMAWSVGARFADGTAAATTCPEGRNSCRNCLHRALEWRARVIEQWDQARARAGAAGATVVRPPPLAVRRPPAQTELFAAHRQLAGPVPRANPGLLGGHNPGGGRARR